MESLARTPSVRLTYADYALLPDDGRRHEVIDGDLLVTPAPNARHQKILFNLTLALGNFLRRAPAGAQPPGEVFLAPFDVLLTEFDIVQPDLLFLSAERRHLRTDQNLQGAPDLVVEILSPGTRRVDERVKRQLYERTGVQEYWIVDPEEETVQIFREAEGAFGEREVLRRQDGAALTTSLLPGLSLALEEIFL